MKVFILLLSVSLFPQFALAEDVNTRLRNLELRMARLEVGTGLELAGSTKCVNHCRESHSFRLLIKDVYGRTISDEVKQYDQAYKCVIHYKSYCE